MTAVEIDSRVRQFAALVNQGIDAWTEAGQLLTRIVKDNPDAYTSILSDNPHLTREILEAFERIGRKEIYPYLFIDSSPGAKRLAALPYDAQVRHYHARVTIAVKSGTSLETREKRVSDLTELEATRLFDGDRMRPVSEQMKILRPIQRIRKVVRIVMPVVAATPAPRRSGEAEVDPLDENPKAELARLLGLANETLLDARTALIRVQRDSPLDDYLTLAFNAIGKLRFAINDGQLA